MSQWNVQKLLFVHDLSGLYLKVLFYPIIELVIMKVNNRTKALNKAIRIGKVAMRF